MCFLEKLTTKEERKDKPTMAELLKIMLTDATAEEQAIFESTPTDFVIMTNENPQQLLEINVKGFYKGKNEILDLIKSGIPDNCYYGIVGIDEIKNNNNNEAQALYISKLYLIEKSPAIISQYDILPTSPALYLFNSAVTHNSKKKLIPTTKNGTRQSDRHQIITYSQIKDGYKLTQTNSRSGQVLELSFMNVDKMQGKGVKKCFAFLLTQSNKQHFNPVISFSLSELVERGMYSTIDNARRGLKAALDTLQNIRFSGTIKKGNNKSITQAEAGVLFYHYKIKNNSVEVSVNENFNIEFIAAYYALFPQFAYALSNSNSFDLCEYIFMQARTNSQAIKEKGGFTVSFKKIRELLALPEEAEITQKNKKWKPKQYVIEPILTAIKDLQAEAKKSKYNDFEITAVYDVNYNNLNEFLDGYIKITFKGEVYNSLIKIAEQQEEKIEQAINHRQKIIEARQEKAK